MCEEIIINDHPIHIRDQLTRRAALVSVEQQTGTSIIVKGRFYPPGAPRAPNNPPLLLHITAASHVGMVRLLWLPSGISHGSPAQLELRLCAISIFLWRIRCLFLQDEFTKRIAVSRAAAHVHAILRGQATPMSPVPPHPSNTPLAPPPDMLLRPDAQASMRPSLPMHPSMQMPPGYFAGQPSPQQHPMHAPAMHAAPLGMPHASGPGPQLQHGMPYALSGAGPAHHHAAAAQFTPASSASLLAPPHHTQQSLYPQTRPDSMAHVPPALAHNLSQTQPHFQGSHQAQQLQPSGAAIANLNPDRASAPDGVIMPPGTHSGSSSAAPQAAHPGPHAPSGGSLPPAAQAGSACIVAVDFSAPPSFDIVQRLRGPANAYISHIERETGATIQLRGHGSGSQAGAGEPLHIHIHHPEPWRRKPAEDLIHSLLQTVRSAASTPGAQPVASQPAAPQPHAPPHMQLVPSAAPAVPASGQMQQGGWSGGTAVHSHDAIWPAAYGHHAQPVHVQPAAYGGRFSMVPPQAAARPGQPQPSDVPPGPHQGFSHPVRSKPGFDPEAPMPSATPANSLPPSGSAVPSHCRHNTGDRWAAGAQAAGSEEGQQRQQPAKRKFREFKEEAKSTQSRVCCLLRVLVPARRG